LRNIIRWIDLNTNRLQQIGFPFEEGQVFVHFHLPDYQSGVKPDAGWYSQDE
jgi:hypothetical protein